MTLTRAKGKKKPWAHEAVDYPRAGQGTEQLVSLIIKIEMEIDKIYRTRC